ncbi:MAG: YhdP family protein [Betaproteobacteria bacterium]
MRVVRLFAYVLIAGFGAFCVLLLLLRYVVMPQVPAHRDEIAGFLSRKIGAPLEIDALATGWDGWNPKLVIDGFRVHAAPGAPTVLDLPHVELVAAWTSLALLQLRLKQLTIDRPSLAIRRNASGRFHVAGMEIDPQRAGTDSRFLPWLLRQREIEVRDAVVSWNDEARAAPPLTFEHVQLRLQNEFGRHRFGATGVPPAALAAPLDVRGDVAGASLTDWHAAKGDVYLRLDYADVAAWRAWLPLPVDVDSGQGALRLWFHVAGGIATSVVADVELADVHARLRPDLPELTLPHVVGHLQWQDDGRKRSIAGRGVSFTTQSGIVHAPTDFGIDITTGATDADTRGSATFARVDLASLAVVASALPFPQAWREQLAAHAPHGAVTDGRYEWQGSTDAPLHWSARGALAEVGAAAHDRWPGIERISGTFDTDERTGVLNLATRAGVVDVPGVMSEDLRFERLDGQVRWSHDQEGLRIDLKDVAFANADAAGAIGGYWRALPKGPGEVDLKAQFTRANVARVAEYLPVTFAPAVRDWLRRALVKGNAPNAQVALQGNLADFPFEGGKHGVFTVTAQVHGGTLDYANGWPQVDDIDADVRIDRAHVRVEGSRGGVLDTRLGRTVADIADISQPMLTVEGSATGAAPAFLQFVRQSPAAEWTGHAVDGVQASGDGALDYRIVLSLRHVEPTRLQGSFALDGGVVTLPGVPPLARAAGKLTFNEKGLADGDFTAELMGGAARVALRGADDGLHINASGSADLTLLRKYYPVGFVDRVRGTSDWRFDAVALADGMAWNVDSSMQGATIDLPAPFGKDAAAELPVRIERRATDARGGRDTLSIALGAAGSIVMQRRTSGGAEPTIERALILAGSAVAKPGDADRPGVWIRADLPSIDVDEWLAIDTQQPPGAPASRAPPLKLAGLDLVTSRLTAMRRRFGDVNINARRDGDNWQLMLQGRDVDGSAAWFAPAPGTPNGRAVVRLARFALPRLRDEAAGAATADKLAPAPVRNTVNRWPELDVVADNFLSRGHELGRLQMLAQPNGSDWRIDRLDLRNDGGTIAVSGAWHVSDTDERTELAGKLDIGDAGRFLAHFGYADEIRAAPTQIEGSFAWPGAPSDFDYRALNGKLRLTSAAGQFVKIDPGIGKLIGVLSLQALPRRISLDFRDVFSEGFAFDEARGDVDIVNGVLRTDAFRINGPAARVEIRGEADLAHETQQLDVRVQPSLATTFSAGTAGAAMLLLAANPVVAAVVGAGTFLAQKVMQDPIEHLFSYEYRVTGPWTEPVVTRVGRDANRAATREPATAGGTTPNGAIDPAAPSPSAASPSPSTTRK